MKENYLEALKWYGKAADMGNAEAKYKLGKILLEEGKRYLLESCVQGNIAASEFIKEKQIGISYEDCIVFSSPEPFSISARKTWNGTIEYSLDKINWHNWGGKEIKSYIIYMRGCGNTVITGRYYSGRYWEFETKDKLICRGNIEALLDYKLCSRGEHPPMGKECYKSMFKGCTSLSEAPALPARELAKDCYTSMFEGCTSLKKAPALPATKLAEFCYYSMFKGCTSLSEAPALPARELALECYCAMFWGCTSLKEAPALPATELVYGCYNLMFSGCTSLEKAPALPATELADWCYKSMFKGCTSLVEAPALPAKKLAECCYCRMFEGCTSLSEAPALPAMELAMLCYYGMFEGCISLKDRSNLPKSCFE